MEDDQIGTKVLALVTGFDFSIQSRERSEKLGGEKHQN